MKTNELTNKSEISVSIIICIFNTEKYIRECLDSVVGQSLKNIEIICVNDGSTDSSLEILQEYANRYFNIVLIDQKNSGLATSRNNAIKIARGKYLVFVDSDDWIQENMLEVLYTKMEKQQLDMLSFSGVNFKDGSTDSLPNNYWNFKYLPKGFNTESFHYKECAKFLHKMAVSSCLTMYRLDFIKQNEIYFPDKLYFEDNVFFVKTITSANRCGIVKDKFYYRRIHGDSITQNWDRHFSDYLKIVSIVLNYLKSINIDSAIYEKYKRMYFRNSVRRYNSFSSFWQEKYRDEFNDFIHVNNMNKIINDIRFLGISLFSHYYFIDMEKFSILGIEVYKRKFKDDKRKYYFLGIPIYSSKKKKSNK